MDTIIKSAGLYKSYKMGQSTLEVLKGLDLSVDKGEFVAIVGASGSGKSTLLHILGTLDKPDSGSVFYKGSDLARFSQKKLNAFRNTSVGFVFQFYHLLDELDVLENVMLPAMAKFTTLGWISRRKSTKKRAAELLGRLGMQDRVKHRPFQLSGGERQRVAIARALINQPQLLLADEPTGNLDSETGNGILEVLEQLNSNGQTVIMVTHDESIANRGHKLIRLVDGKIV
jgi:lipoprotein-releasing system ATP-binding protein